MTDTASAALLKLIAEWRADQRCHYPDFDGGVEEGRLMCADELEAVLASLPAPAAPEETALAHIDMLMVDRLQQWAHNIETHGTDMGYWGGDHLFVAGRMRYIAKGIEDAIKATPSAAPEEEWKAPNPRQPLTLDDPER